MALISVTLDVSKLVMFNELKFVVSLNIEIIVVTLLVLKLDRSNVVRLEVLLNM